MYHSQCRLVARSREPWGWRNAYRGSCRVRSQPLPFESLVDRDVGAKPQFPKIHPSRFERRPMDALRRGA